MSKDKQAPRNTTQEARNNPALIVMEAAIVGTDAISNQESQGQRSFVDSTTLPTKMGGPETKAALEAAGVRFGEAVEGDPLFTYVNLPEGWQKVSTDHSMWNNLIDDKGRTRATIFYKAAFYDRDAHLTISRRFNVKKDYSREDGLVVFQVLDRGEIVFATAPVEKEGYVTDDNQRVLAETWLNKSYPEWQDYNAYWD